MIKSDRKQQIIEGIKTNLLNQFGKTVKTANKAQFYLAAPWSRGKKSWPAG
jgi:hypothetical protein